MVILSYRSALPKVWAKYGMRIRPLCPVCNSKPVAINYIRDEVTHYRKKCDPCNRKKRKLPQQKSSWVKSGYKKKPACEKCGFVAKHTEQLNVFHVDGNLKNNDWSNLKTVCANCTIEIGKARLPWKISPLSPDL
jgi:hypothetical protein